MDWIEQDVNWTAHDFRIFGFQERHGVVLRKKDTEEGALVVRDDLYNKNDWEEWFDSAPSIGGAENELCVLLCSRELPVFEDECAPVSYLPMTRGTWERVTREFQVDRSINRTICRQVACFSSVHQKNGASQTSNLAFTARMSAYLPDDLAMSVTYVPHSEMTYSVVYGCNEQQITAIEKRVQSAGDSSRHPMLMIGIFAELERERLVAHVDKLLDQFAVRSDKLETGSYQSSSEISSAKTQEYLALCVQSRSLIDHIHAVKRQLSKLLDEIENVGNNVYRKRDKVLPDDVKKKRQQVKRIGLQMSRRLRDIMDEYDDKVDECNMVIGNTSLAMETVWSHIATVDAKINTRISRANTTIALETKRESTQMRSIALLTMIYLPLSCVASIFSMDLFKWDAEGGESVVSKYFWIFVVLAIGLTVITMGAWRLVTNRHEKESRRSEESYGTLIAEKAV